MANGCKSSVVVGACLFLVVLLAHNGRAAPKAELAIKIVEEGGETTIPCQLPSGAIFLRWEKQNG